jgi:hypothetical protein
MTENLALIMILASTLLVLARRIHIGNMEVFS